MVRISLQGIDQLKAQLASLGPNAQVELENGVVEEMRKLMAQAQRKVPVYTGALRSTAFVRTALRNQSRTDWTFGYESPYAMFVHEHPNAHTNEDGHPCACYATIHRPRAGMLRNGKGYKWLEKVVKERGDMVGAVFRRVRNALLIAGGQRNGSRPAAPQPPEAGGAVSKPRSGGGKGGGGGGGALGGYLKTLLELAAKGRK